nr:Rab family GTPase [Candidatus Sigynarchaeota archaeon]
MPRSTPQISGSGNTNARKKFVLKIITASDSGCGKDVLLHRFVSNRFIADTSMTVGVQFHLKNITFGGIEITLQLWDFGGQDRFRFLLPTYTSGAKGFILFFDLTRMQTTFSLENSWLPIVRKEDPNLPGILVGTKQNLVDHDFPAIEPEFGPDFITRARMQGYVESPSNSGEQIDRAFRILLKAILDYNRIPYGQNLI